MPNDAAAGRPDSAVMDYAVALEVEQATETTQELRLQAAAAAINEPLPAVQHKDLAGGHVAWISARSPFKSGPNEDAVAAIPISPERGILLVADGLGGHRDGHRASQMVRSSLVKAGRQLAAKPQNLLLSKVVPIPAPAGLVSTPAVDPRSLILEEIERANLRLLRSRAGSATTLAVVEIKGRRVRSYHIGDSEILVVSQRGRLKFSTVSHSPIGYAVQSGMLTEEQALFHPDRHLVSNVIGSEHMSVELGPWVSLSARDTVLIASDGLFDNLMQFEIIECIRKGKLSESVLELATIARRRMVLPDADFPSKPDDLTVLAYRAS